MNDFLKLSILTLSVMLSAVSLSAAHPKIVAHRGYWDAAGSAQNSLRSLAKADSVGSWGSEFDVWRSSDGVLFCNHDRTFKGVTFTDATSKVISAVVLDNGEPVPTLESMLEEAGRHPSLRLVFELKEHADKTAEEAAVRESIALVEKMGLADRTEYISFSKQAIINFARHAPAGTDIYYLTGDLTPAQVKVVGGTGIDYNINILKAHPEWIAEAHDLGMKVNIWTVDQPEDMKWCIDNGADIITTNQPVVLSEVIAGSL